MSLLAFFSDVPVVGATVTEYGAMRVLAGSVRLAADAPSTATADVPRAALGETPVGACVRLDHPTRGRSWWWLAGIDRSLGDAVVRVSLAPLRAALNFRGFVRETTAGEATSYRLDVSRETVASLLTKYVLANAAEDGLGWLRGIGRIAYNGTVDIGAQLAEATREQVCQAIEAATSMPLRLEEARDSAGDLVGFDFVLEPIGAGVSTLPAYQGGGVMRIGQTQALQDVRTVVLPLDGSGTTLGPTVWRVAATTSGTPAWVQLVDPAGGDPPIAEDDQFIGNFIELADGSSLEITDSRASDSAVQVARPVAVGVLVALVRDATGAPITEIRSPSGVARHGVVVGKAQVARTRTERTYIANGGFADGLTGWTHVGTPSPNGRLVARSRRDPVRLDGTVATAAGAGATSLALTMPSAAVLHRTDWLRLDAWTPTLGGGVGDALGRVTLTVAPVVPAGGIADQTPLPITVAGRTLATRAFGAQTAGAGTVTVEGLTPIPAPAAGQTLVTTQGAVVRVGITFQPLGADVVTFGGDIPVDISAGTVVAVTESWLVWDAKPGGARGTSFVSRVETVTSTGTVTATVLAGAAAIEVDFDNARVVPNSSDEDGAPSRVGLGGSFAVQSASVVTYTLSGSPPSWNASGESTVSFTPALTAALEVGTRPVWSGGAVVVVAAPAGVGTSSVALRLDDPNAVIPSGGTMTLLGEDIQIGETRPAAPDGTVTVPLASALAAAAGVGRGVRIVRCPDFLDDEGGSETLLQFDVLGVGLTTLVIARSTPSLIRVAPGDSATVRLFAGMTVWGPRQTGLTQRYRVEAAITTAAGSVLATDDRLGSFIVEGNDYVRQHISLRASEVLSASAVRAVQLNVSRPDAIQFQAFARHAMLTVSSDSAVPHTASSFSNVPHQRANAVLQARSFPDRLRIEGATLQRWLDTVGDEATTVGQRVRLVAPELGVDRMVRVLALSYDLRDTSAESIELGILDPRLASVVVA
jgi:hypothetical protein